MKNMLSKEVSSTGTAIDKNARVITVILSGGSDAASVVLRDGGSEGTIKLTLKTSANDSRIVPIGGRGIEFDIDVYATLTGTGPVVDIIYD